MQLFSILSHKFDHNLLRFWARGQGQVDIAALCAFTQNICDLEVKLVGAGNPAQSPDIWKASILQWNWWWW